MDMMEDTSFHQREHRILKGHYLLVQIKNHIRYLK